MESWLSHILDTVEALKHYREVQDRRELKRGERIADLELWISEMESLFRKANAANSMAPALAKQPATAVVVFHNAPTSILTLLLYKFSSQVVPQGGETLCTSPHGGQFEEGYIAPADPADIVIQDATQMPFERWMSS
ncbi:hypothetical protein L202_05711 [Cryptococcus amylolentus CBS 6039]|uniref:Uncharacterized protein n=2 Tax=Cryptococcus amylolentus TaxID=104669 RepID=A0A1E3HLG8_9TREE|nr:hypothetical protein L202_05711 [Cryptococcus amylolentus CBS 6039]ODN77188.1 hypothetical protein L202_05711 [Cryptococcus amylolentus CBS 6039]ODO05026.1 hypothetical protein I350_05638 [Cryptococcus amylolentus CBS 6273]